MPRDDISKYLPLTEATFYIMISLIEPLHGYGVMKKVRELSSGTVKVGPGTLYGAFGVLEKEGLIVRDREEKRRKLYILSIKGRMVLDRQIQRLETMAKVGAASRTRL